MPYAKHQRLVVHSARNGGPLGGNAFNYDSRFMPDNQPRALINCMARQNGTVVMPMPGIRPLGHGFSLRHRASEHLGYNIEGSSAVDRASGVSVWFINPGPGHEPVVALMHHNYGEAGSAGESPWPDEIMLMRGWRPKGGAVPFLNHSPLVGWEVDDAGVYVIDWDSLLSAGTAASMDVYQPTGHTQDMMIVAIDNNPLKKIEAADIAEGFALRAFGLNPPQADPTVETTAVCSVEETPTGRNVGLGQQVSIKHSSDTGNIFSFDPDYLSGNDYDISGSAYIELDMGDSGGTMSPRAIPASRLAFIPIEITGALTLRIVWVAYDAQEGTVSEVTEDISITGAATTLDVVSDGSPSSGMLWRAWDKVYVSNRYYKTNRPGEYPKITVSGAGGIGKILVYRAAEPFSTDDVYREVRLAYAWIKRNGAYESRGGHSDGFSTAKWQRPFAVGYNGRIAGFPDPMSDDEPTHVALLVRSTGITDLNIIENDLETPGKEGKGPTGYWKSHYAVREMPIHKVNGVWKTNTGFPAHDIPIDEAVMDVPYDEIGVLNTTNSWPGNLTTLGGCTGCTQWNGALWTYGYSKHQFTRLTAAGNTYGYARFTSEDDTFAGWMIGRTLVFKGISYGIRRIIREVTVDTDLATIECVNTYDGDADETDAAFLEPMLNVLRATLTDALFAEVSPLAYTFSLPVYDEIQSVVSLKNWLLIQGKRYTWQLTQDSDGYPYVEDVTPPITRIDKLSADTGAAGKHSTVLAEGTVVNYTGRSIAFGANPDAFQDITTAQNARLWEDLFAPAQTPRSQLAYDAVKRMLVLANVRSKTPVFGNNPEWGMLLDQSNNWAMALAYPWPTYCAGDAKIAQGIRARTAIRDGYVAMFAQVTTVGTGGLVSATGPYLILYNVIADSWTAVDLTDVSDSISTVVPSYFASSIYHGGMRATVAGTDGHLYLIAGAGNSRYRAEINPTTGAVVSAEYLYVHDFLDLALSWTGKIIGIGAGLTDDADYDIFEFGLDTIDQPWDTAKGGGRRYAITGDEFQSNGASAELVPAICIGPSGEIVLVGYYLDGSDYKLKIRRIDPHTFQPVGEDIDCVGFNEFDPAEDTWTPGTFTGTPVRDLANTARTGICQIAMNRHGELWFTHIDSSYNRALYRFRFPRNGYVGAGGVANLAEKIADGTPTSDVVDGVMEEIPNDATLNGVIGMMIDTRAQTWVVTPRLLDDTSEFGFDVGIVMEHTRCESVGGGSNNALPISRAGYSRYCYGMAQAGAKVFFIAKDVKTADSSVEWRLIECVGNDSDGYDGGPELVTSYATTVAAGKESTNYTDLSTKIAGTGGVLSLVSVQGNPHENSSRPCDANGTATIHMRGLGSV